MQKTLHIRTTVLPGGRVEIVDHELPVGSQSALLFVFGCGVVSVGVLGFD